MTLNPRVTQRYARQANLPLRFKDKRFADVDLDSYPSAIVTLVKTWTQSLVDGKVIGVTGQGLFFTGQPGHGKTLLACAVGNEVMARAEARVYYSGEYGNAYCPVYFTRWTALLQLYRGLMDDDSDEDSRTARAVLGNYPDPAWNVQLLILDDIGREHVGGTGWNSAQLDSLLRQRFDNGLPTIVTSNIPLHASKGMDWAKAYGDATASLISESSSVIDLTHRYGDQRLLV